MGKKPTFLGSSMHRNFFFPFKDSLQRIFSWTYQQIQDRPGDHHEGGRVKNSDTEK